MKKWIDKLKERFRVDARVRYWIIKAKSTTLPFFDGVPIYHVFMFIYKEIQRDDIVTRANSMAYSFFLALFPFLLVMLSILYFLPYDLDVDAYLANLPEVIPLEARETIERMVLDVLKVPRGGILSVGFLLALFFSSNGMITMMKGFDKAAEQSFVSRNFIQTRLVALKLTLLIGLLFLTSLVTIVFGDFLLNLFLGDHLGAFQYYFLKVFKWLAVILLFYGGISTLYYYGPSLQSRFRFFSLGSTVATGLSLITSLMFSLYIDNFARYSEIYGSIGAFLIILIWLQLNCLILILGFELNASIRVNRNRMELEELEKT